VPAITVCKVEPPNRCHKKDTLVVIIGSIRNPKGFGVMEDKMRTKVLAIIAAGTIGAAAVNAPTKADASCYGCWAGAAIAAGIIGGAIIASNAYGYGYYGGYGPYYGGYYAPAYYGPAPAYGYGYRPYRYYGGYYSRRYYGGPYRAARGYYRPYARAYYRY
jgi:hypothetical protein